MYHNSYELLKQVDYNVGMLFLEDTHQEVYMRALKSRSQSSGDTFHYFYSKSYEYKPVKIKKGFAKGNIKFIKVSNRNSINSLEWI